MKVLELFGEPVSDGGQEMFVSNFLKRLSRDRYKAELLTPYGVKNGNCREICSELDIPVCSLHADFKKRNSIRSVAIPLFKFFKDKKYDIIHIHSGSIYSLALLSIIARLSTNSRIIVHSHSGIGTVSTMRKMLITAASVIFSLTADGFCACSLNAARSKFTENVIQKKLKIIKNGIDTELFRYDPEKRVKMRDRLRIGKSSTVIGHVGRFTYEKNHRFILELFKKYLRKNNDSILLLVGGGQLRGDIEELAKKYKIRDRVIFAGSVKNVSEYLCAMDVFVFPSIYEGLGMAAIEAQSTGLPLIVSDRVPKEISVTDNVVFLPLDDIDRWCRYIEKLSNTRITDGAEKVKKHGYSNEYSAKEIGDIYESIF